MPLELTPVNLHDPAECVQWDRLVESAPSGTVYHSSAWLLALRGGMGQDVRAYAIGRSGEWRAGAVIRRAARLGLAVARKPWATAYTLFLAQGAEADAHALMMALARRYPCVRLVLFGQASPPDGWRAAQVVTPMLGPADPADLWRAFDRHARQRVRKAEAAGVVAEETRDTRMFYDLYRLTYLRQGLDMPLSRTCVADTLDAAIRARAARLYAAYVNDEPAAALLVGLDGRRLYFMLAASHPQLRKTDAVTFLWWHVMQQYPGREIDLVGHGVDAIDRFKASFSPRYAPVLDLTGYGAGPVGTLLLTSERLRHTLDRLKHAPTKAPT